MRQFSWEEWTDFMRDIENISIPETIELCVIKNGAQEWTQKLTRDATIYELTTAIVDLEREIQRLDKAKDALMAIQTCARGISRDGSMTVDDALFKSAKGESADDLE